MSYRDIIDQIKQAQCIASKNHGIPNILQPGLVKELIIAETLGHKVNFRKDEADASDTDGNQYEYLCSLSSNGNFQIDRMQRSQDNNHIVNEERITRNSAFFFAIFENHVKLVELYKMETWKVLEEVRYQCMNSRNDITHVNMSARWVRDNPEETILGL